MTILLELLGVLDYNCGKCSTHDHQRHIVLPSAVLFFRPQISFYGRAVRNHTTLTQVRKVARRLMALLKCSATLFNRGQIQHNHQEAIYGR